jgi:HlyD family secretion protein
MERYTMRKHPLRILLSGLLGVILAASCSGNGKPFVYSGRTDVDTVTVSSQASGIIESLEVEEGDTVARKGLLGQIATDRLEAQRRQQEAQLAGLDVRLSAAQAQIDQARVQLDFTRETLEKTEKVLAQGGATQQRRDELATQVKVYAATLASLKSNYKVIEAQKDELRAGMAITDMAIRDARIVSPIDGVVLNKFHTAGELAAVGTPLLEIADLSTMNVGIYIPLEKLGSVSLGDPAVVTASGVEGQLRGTVAWISSIAEFTPKTILTEETRTTLVYEVKIRVSNPGGVLKIGVPVDVRLP